METWRQRHLRNLATGATLLTKEDHLIWSSIVSCEDWSFFLERRKPTLVATGNTHRKVHEWYEELADHVS